MKQQQKPVQKSEPKTAEIVRHGGESAIAAPPEYLRKGERDAAGLEYMSSTDVTVPRLGLCQSNSPQRIRNDAKYIEGLTDGEFFNSISRENYGNSVLIVPLLFYKSRIRYGKTMGDPLRCQALDGLHGVGDPGGSCLTCPLAQFGTSEKEGSNAPACQEFFNYASLVVEDGGRVSPQGLVVFSLKSTAIKVAKEWNSLIRFRNADMFAGIYRIKSAARADGKHNWWTAVVENAGWVSQQAYESAKVAYAAVAALQREGRFRFDAEAIGEGVSQA